MRGPFVQRKWKEKHFAILRVTAPYKANSFLDVRLSPPILLTMSVEALRCFLGVLMN